jgi:hypothetical protein
VRTFRSSYYSSATTFNELRKVAGTSRYYIMDGLAACKHETLSGQWHLPAEMPDELRTGRSRLGRFARH